MTIKVGDTVRYRGEYLRSIGAYCGPLGFAKGTVTGFKELSPDMILADIEWDWPSEEVPNRVNVKNLEKTRKAR